MDRSDEDRVSGILRLRFGSVEREVPTLPLRPARDWQRMVAGLSGGFGLPTLDDWQQPDAGRFANLTVDALLDLAIAYDRTGALGGRDWLEDNADPSELFAAVSAMAENAFPFAEDGRRLLATMVVSAAVVPSPRPSSTNGRSRTGVSTRVDSTTPLTESSS